MHWERVHGITRTNAKKELKDGEVPTNPYWLKSGDGNARMIPADVDKSLVLPVIFDHLEREEKIPWHYRDCTFKLYKEGHIDSNALDWGSELRRSAR